MRRHYCVTYDVSDDKRRTRVFKLLFGYGDHVQYSVFFCELNDAELATLRGRLRREISQKEDQILVIDLGLSTTPLEAGIEVLGRGYTPSTRTIVI